MKAQPTGTDGMICDWPAPGEIAWCGDGVNEGHARLKIVKIVLTVAHLDHTPENCAHDNLRSWCQRCHNKYDAKMRREGIKQRRHAAQSNDLFAGAAGVAGRGKEAIP